MMKKITAILLALLIAISLVACNGANQKPVNPDTGSGTTASTGTGSGGSASGTGSTTGGGSSASGGDEAEIDWSKYEDLVAKTPDYQSGLTEDYEKTFAAAQETQPTFDKSASKWIWTADTETKNVWVRFRKTFDLTTVPTKAVTKISAESRYFLYVNGELAVYDGGLKRGNFREGGYYDEIDIAKYLQKGENVICALVWYWGVKGQSYSNVSAGKPGFILQTKIGSTLIATDGTWKAQRDVAYTTGKSGEQEPNYRLPEYNISYDATASVDDNWINKDFSDSKWSDATVIGNYGDSPWKNLSKRTIPLPKDYGVTPYLNSEDYVGATTTARKGYIMSVGTNVQLSPVFTIVSEKAGERITITTENTKDSQGDSVRCYYYTKKGEQTFECLSWMNGQFVTYDLPAGTTIKFLGYRQTGYDTEKVGSFSSSGEFFNRLWQMSYDTLYVTMRDNFMDCPNRERAQWMGDVTNEMEQIIYSMDENSFLLYEKALKQMTGFADGTVLPTVAPIQSAWFELPVQNLCTISGAWTYYMYTGRSAVLSSTYQYFYRYLKLWTLQDNGLVVHRSGSWDWMDNDDGGASHTEAIENAWYYKALGAVKNMALLFNNESICEFADERMEKIYKGFQTNLLQKMITRGDDRANSIAVLAGLVPTTEYQKVTQVLTNNKTCSPFWEKYVLEALCEMGEYKAALQRMVVRYSPMVYETMYGEDYSTLWEKWNTSGGTRNHAWSGGPMTVLSKYILGVQPLTSNYDDVLIKPNLSTLTMVEGVVPTTKGNITVSASKTSEGLTMNVSTFKKTNAVIAIPFSKTQNLIINDVLIVSEGKILKSTGTLTYAGIDDEYIYFTASGGTYNIIVE